MNWSESPPAPQHPDNPDEALESADALYPGDSGELSLDARRVLVLLLAGPSLDGQRHSRLWPILIRDELAIRSRLAETDYPRYRSRGWTIGSGMVESSAKQLVGLRLKGPGMHWGSPHGETTVTELRTSDLSGQWHTSWNSQTLPPLTRIIHVRLRMACWGARTTA